MCVVAVVNDIPGNKFDAYIGPRKVELPVIVHEMPGAAGPANILPEIFMLQLVPATSICDVAVADGD